ncbi:hypothetical protein C4564_01345 [Candidatus Microgenomates bacterium]|nr:MAG: hypothetical protein C4564_01345 [Candidatus Microgenomates bacterium]
MAFIGLMFVFGVPAISAFLNFATGLSGKTPIVSEGLATRPSPPHLEAIPDYTNEKKIKISGSANSGSTVEINFNGSKKETLVSAQGTFTASYELKKGPNTIEAKTLGSGGTESVSTREHTIVFDDTAPELTIITPSDGDSFYGYTNEQIAIEGQTETEVSVSINGRYAIVDNSGKFNFRVSLGEGENNFSVVAKDKAGNETKTEFKITFSK